MGIKTGTREKGNIWNTMAGLPNVGHSGLFLMALARSGIVRISSLNHHRAAGHFCERRVLLIHP